MSRSIKHYKKAMDRIKISDSFYERTELLLKENSDDERISVSSRKSIARYIFPAAAITAAACAALIFTLNPNILDEDISAETVVSQTTVTSEVTPASETIYIDIEEDDTIYGIIPAAIPDVTVTSDNNRTDQDSIVTETSAALTIIQKDETYSNSAETVNASSDDAASAEKSDAAQQIKSLYEIDFANYETSLTSYLHSGLASDTPAYYAEDGGFYEVLAPSGLNSLILDENAASETVTMIADAVYSAPAVSGKEIVHTEFSVDITDAVTGKTSFTINICFDKTIEVTAYEQDKPYSTFYAVADHDFIEIEKRLFLKFGSAAQYEDFINNV